MSITLPNGFEKIDDFAFLDCINLREIIIPESLKLMGISAFFDCTSLTNVTYEGTVDQWKSVSKRMDWAHRSVFDVVHCTDGDVPIE